MMALFGMVWLLKVRKHLRHCAHCRAHLRTCSQCRARPSPSLPSIVNSRDSTKESCAQDTASQTSPPEQERTRITLDLVAHRPPPRGGEDSDTDGVNGSDGDHEITRDEKRDNNGTDERTAGEELEAVGGSDDCNGENNEIQFIYGGRVSPSLPTPPPPPVRSPAVSPRRPHDPPVNVAQEPCDSEARSLASRVCTMYGQEPNRTDSARERRKSFGSTKRRSLSGMDELDQGDSANARTSTLPRQSSTGSGYRFCYTPGHTHPYACPPLAGSTPHLPHLTQNNQNSKSVQDSRADPLLPASTQQHTAHPGHPPTIVHPSLEAHQQQTLPVVHPLPHHPRDVPQVTLDPRLLPMDSLEGAYGGSDSSRSSHSGSRSSYSDHSLPPPLPFSEGAIHYLPTPPPPSAHILAPNTAHTQYHPSSNNDQWMGREAVGYSLQKSDRELAEYRQPQYSDGVWSIPTSSTTTTFLGAEYPRYDPTTVPGRDRRPFSHYDLYYDAQVDSHGTSSSSPRQGHGTLPRSHSTSSSRSHHRSPVRGSHSRSPSRHRAGKLDLLEACGGVDGHRLCDSGRGNWDHGGGGVAATASGGDGLPPPPVDWGASGASSRTPFCALHGYGRNKGKWLRVPAVVSDSWALYRKGIFKTTGRHVTEG
ncbi:inactive histone-lysine N-methyltransferase 2E-like [Macrobrachium nipponense]|uniref:inactive histone-lysine N-methyltransferase 2E-like n=1 Tax=Macrobrachium nipponense TaxID=159736 RepID=UPI0030C86691